MSTIITVGDIQKALGKKRMEKVESVTHDGDVIYVDVLPKFYTENMIKYGSYGLVYGLDCEEEREPKSKVLKTLLDEFDALGLKA